MADNETFSIDSNTTMTSNKMSHKKWKAYLKKMKRKAKRTAEAQKRDADNADVKENTSGTDSEEERKRAWEESESLRQNILWMERERQAELAFQAKKEWEEKEKKRKEETERKIREEWEEREKKEREEKEEKERREQEKKEKQVHSMKSNHPGHTLTEPFEALYLKHIDHNKVMAVGGWRALLDKLLREATANENTSSWHNPIGPVRHPQPSQERQVDACPFFKKTATCRFGDQCSRFHDHPDSSCTVLLAGMFSCFELEQSVVNNQDTDISLEYDDNDMYHSFKDFYEDVLPEFKTVGTVRQFKVCCNYESHLRGNVYVQYKRESAAMSAYQKFNARWYGGRQITCRFVNIESWKAAICGLAFRNRCPKGKACNFLHVFRNPGNEFANMDHDRSPQPEGGRSVRSYRGRDERGVSSSSSIRSHRESSVRSHYSHSHSNRHGYSRRRYSRSRSRSRSRSHSHSVSSRRKSKGSKSHRRSSRSRSRSTSRSRRVSVSIKNGHSSSSSSVRQRHRSRSSQSSDSSSSKTSKIRDHKRRRRSGYSKSKSRSRSKDKESERSKTTKSRNSHRSVSRSRSRSRSQSKYREEERNSMRSHSRSRSCSKLISECANRKSGSDSGLRKHKILRRSKSRSRSKSDLRNEYKSKKEEEEEEEEKMGSRSRSRSKSGSIKNDEKNRSRSRSKSGSSKHDGKNRSRSRSYSRSRSRSRSGSRSKKSGKESVSKRRKGHRRTNSKSRSRSRSKDRKSIKRGSSRKNDEDSNNKRKMKKKKRRSRSSSGCSESGEEVYEYTEVTKETLDVVTTKP